MAKPGFYFLAGVPSSRAFRKVLALG